MLKTKISGSIGIGSTQTLPIITNEYTLAGIVITGSVITGSQVSFLVSANGVDYYPLYDYSGSEVLVTVSTTPKAFNLNHEVFEPWNYIKLRLGFSGSSVAQATYPLLVDFVTAAD